MKPRIITVFTKPSFCYRMLLYTCRVCCCYDQPPCLTSTKSRLLSTVYNRKEQSFVKWNGFRFMGTEMKLGKWPRTGSATDCNWNCKIMWLIVQCGCVTISTPKIWNQILLVTDEIVIKFIRTPITKIFASLLARRTFASQSLSCKWSISIWHVVAHKHLFTMEAVSLYKPVISLSKAEFR